MVYTSVLETDAERIESSSLSLPTKQLRVSSVGRTPDFESGCGWFDSITRCQTYRLEEVVWTEK